MHLVLPDEYTTALAYVKAKCPEAILAGGALRDLHTGKEVKDIDIFIIGRPNELEHEFGGARVSNKEFEDYDGLGDIYYVEEITIAGVDVPVQVIHLYPEPSLDKDFMRRVVERIDLGFCQVGYNGTEFLSTDLYVQDMRNKTITVNPYNPDWNAEATHNRITRLCNWGLDTGTPFQSKYHDWQVVGA